MLTGETYDPGLTVVSETGIIPPEFEILPDGAYIIGLHQNYNSFDGEIEVYPLLFEVVDGEIVFDSEETDSNEELYGPDDTPLFETVTPFLSFSFVLLPVGLGILTKLRNRAINKSD